MTEILLSLVAFVVLFAIGVSFCRDYEDAKDAGYIQTDYEEERDDEGDE